MSDVSAATARARVSLPAGLWIAPPALLVGALFFYPLALIASAALHGDDGGFAPRGALAVIGSRYFLNALLNTAEIALASTAGCLAVGLTLGVILAFAPFPGGKLAARLIESFIALPTFLVTLAFAFIYGSAGILNGALVGAFGLSSPPVDFLYSMGGVVLAEVTVYSPFVLRPLLAAFGQIDKAQLEVASLLGAKPWLIIRRIVLPAAAPTLLAAGSLCLLLTVNEFGIVLFIGAKGVITLPLLIYDKAIQEADYQTACAIAIINVALSLTLFGVYRNVAKRFGA